MSRSMYKYYMCGYNGFQQIYQCLDTTTCNLSENITSAHGQHTDGSLQTDTENEKETSNSTNVKNSVLDVYVANNSSNDKVCGSPVKDCHGNISVQASRPIGLKSQVLSTQITSPESDLSPSQCVCLPKVMRLKPVLWTWSQIWTKSHSDCLYGCHGYNSRCITAALKGTCNSIPEPVTQVQGHNILVKNGEEYMVVNENGTVAMVTADIDDVTIVESTKDKIYGTKEDQVYEGEIQTLCDGRMGISYKSLTMSIPIDTVSCGLDHTVMLSKCGVVFSLGSGSRGQLGHGEVTVDYQHLPKKIQTFEGICVVTIATGGWHSCAVTDTGDLYVWGWNESGQLGLSNGSVSHSQQDGTLSSNNKHMECEQCVHEHVQHSGSQKYCENNTHATDSCTDEPVCPATLKNEDLEEACDSDCGSKVRKLAKKPVQKKLYQSIDCVTNVRKLVEKPVPTKLYQSIDCVQIQTVPYGLDIPDEFNVKVVTCGSRHTCVLFDCGSVYTTGWNKYGQLCHDDCRTRDVLELVPYFTNHQFRVVDVKANVWNTVVATEN